MHGRLQIAQLVTVECGPNRSGLKFSGVVLESSEAEVVIRAEGAGSNLAAATAVGLTVELSFGDSMGLHRAETTVVRVVMVPEPALAVKPPREFNTTQKRNFFRVYTKLAAPYQIIQSVIEAEIGKEDREALSQDISAGGLRLWTGRKVLVGDRIRIQIACPAAEEVPLGRPRASGCGDARTVVLNAEVLRVEKITTTKQDRYTVGARFVDLSAAEQDRMVGLMFELQRRQLDR